MSFSREAVLNALPPEWPVDLLPEIQASVARDSRKVVVLDDDPTGTQTVHDVTVLTAWSPDALVAAFQDPEPVVYLLTNSRSLPAAEAQALNREITLRLVRARAQAGRDFVLASRSDSTLRGHFPQEVYALAEGTGEALDGILLVPFFLEGGRYTIDDVHYAAEGQALVPAAETEYARDAVFGYRSSDLKEWVNEKTGGRVRAEQVQSVSLSELRGGGPEAAYQRLVQLEGGAVCVVNAAAYRDLEVFVAGLLRAEEDGKRFIYRTAASFVRVRGGLEPRGPIPARELASPGPGLIVAGSYIEKSSRQIEAARALPDVDGLEVSVEALLDDARRAAEIQRVIGAVDAVLAGGRTALVYTSRRLAASGGSVSPLEIGRSVSAGLVEIVQGIQTRPGWMVAKGGITSSDVATQGLGIRSARVLGHALPGVPAWRAGPESRWPGLLYIVFPGNVGGPEALAEVIFRLRVEKA